MAIDLLVLGLDGVLFDTETAHFLSSNHAFRKCRLSRQWSIEQYRNAALGYGAANATDSVAEMLGSSIGRSDAATLAKEKSRQFHDLACQGRIELHRGCASLINEALEEGCKLAIVTDLPASTATVLLEQAFNDRLTDMFAAIASAASLDSSTGNNAYHLVLRTVGADPWRSVAIESCTPGLLAAQRAGLWTVATTPLAEDLDSVAGSDAWCPHLRMPKHSLTMANLGGSGRSRFVSFELLDALKGAARKNPALAGTAGMAWA